PWFRTFGCGLWNDRRRRRLRVGGRDGVEAGDEARRRHDGADGVLDLHIRHLERQLARRQQDREQRFVLLRGVGNLPPYPIRGNRVGAQYQKDGGALVNRGLDFATKGLTWVDSGVVPYRHVRVVQIFGKRPHIIQVLAAIADEDRR